MCGGGVGGRRRGGAWQGEEAGAAGAEALPAKTEPTFVDLVYSGDISAEESR